MQSNTNRVEFANTLRGFAAVAVVIAHQYGLFWYSRDSAAAMVGAPHLSGESHPIPPLVEWINATPHLNWGSLGVALFFLISGFVIPFSLKRSNFSGFMTGRLFRILPTYAVGFTISILALAISTSYFDSEFIWKPGDIALHYLPGLRDLLGGKNIDGVVWTLEIEMKFYLLCALLLTWFQKKSLKVFLLPIILFFAAFLLNGMTYGWFGFDPYPRRLATTVIFASQFEIFMFIGVVFHYLYEHVISTKTAYALTAGLLSLFTITWLTGPLAGDVSQLANYWLGLTLFLFAYHCPAIVPTNRVTQFLADVSYPLYVIHSIAGYVAMLILIDNGTPPIYAAVIVTASCLAIAWLVHQTVEKPTQVLGKKYAARVMERQTPPPETSAAEETPAPKPAPATTLPRSQAA